MAESRIGFINLIKLEGGGYRAGLLIANRIGVPAEFRYTDPVVPTELQAALYGKSLEAYLKTEVMSKSLVEDSDEKPAALVAPDEGYLPLSAAFKFPVICLQYAKQTPLGKPGDFVEVEGDETVVQTAGSRDPLRLKIDKRNAPAMTSIRTMVVELGQTMDLVEPLGRVTEALEKIAHEK